MNRTECIRMRIANFAKKAFSILMAVLVMVVFNGSHFPDATVSASSDNLATYEYEAESAVPPATAKPSYTEEDIKIIVEMMCYEHMNKRAEVLKQMLELEEVEYEPLYTEQDVIAMAQAAQGEAAITGSDTEITAVMWCICNRYDSNDPYFADCDSIYDIITQKDQFHGYSPNNPIDEHFVELARDVLDRWTAERNGETDVGRTLPPEFLYFYGDGHHNHFSTEYMGGLRYYWTLESPYET